jgi:formate hydrogenlyase subunit 3/multisubunit Na+/H+ antiporter MnhD subunit
MWEEHPQYQKSQMRLIGIVVALLIAIYVVSAVSNHDWNLLGQILLFVGAFAVAFGLLFVFVWLLVKIFTRRQADSTKIEKNHDI